MSDERTDHTLQATALVHEAYLRLVDAEKSQQWNSRGHFFGAAAEAMRRILVEEARRKARLRHGGGRAQVGLSQITLGVDGDELEILDLDEALTRLEQEEPAAAEVVQLRYFTGLTIEQTAAALNISIRTANRHWAFAKAWLYRDLEGNKAN
jgi:RNA polymerase sigma factor (TIGR02999 family)